MGIFHVFSMLDVQSDNAPANAPINVRRCQPPLHSPHPRHIHPPFRPESIAKAPWSSWRDARTEGHCGKPGWPGRLFVL